MLNIAERNNAKFLGSSRMLKPDGVILRRNIFAMPESISRMRNILSGHEKWRGNIMLRMSYRHIRHGINIKGLNINFCSCNWDFAVLYSNT